MDEFKQKILLIQEHFLKEKEIIDEKILKYKGKIKDLKKENNELTYW